VIDARGRGRTAISTRTASSRRAGAAISPRYCRSLLSSRAATTRRCPTPTFPPSLPSSAQANVQRTRRSRSTSCARRGRARSWA
jgi:hypothetical protein